MKLKDYASKFPIRPMPSLSLIRRYEFAAWTLPFQEIDEETRLHYWNLMSQDEVPIEVEDFLSRCEQWLRDNPNGTDMPKEMLEKFPF